MKKTMSDEDLETLIVESREAVEKLTSMWRKGMKVLPINSEIYRSICTAGRKAESLHWKLTFEAEHRGWPESKLYPIRTKGSCSFN